MDIKDILSRIGYVRNSVNLSARELSLRMGMSPQCSPIREGKNCFDSRKTI